MGAAVGDPPRGGLPRCAPGEAVATAFTTDVAHGAFTIEWGDDTGTRRALEIRERYRSLDLE